MSLEEFHSVVDHSGFIGGQGWQGLVISQSVNQGIA
jgi:hypothetical protein